MKTDCCRGYYVIYIVVVSSLFSLTTYHRVVVHSWFGMVHTLYVRVIGFRGFRISDFIIIPNKVNIIFVNKTGQNSRSTRDYKFQKIQKHVFGPSKSEFSVESNGRRLTVQIAREGCDNLN